MNAVTIMTDAEVRRCREPFEGEEPGFGRLATQKGNLPLAAVDVQASITGLLSEIKLVQTFQNVHAEPLEATYIFPLPDRSAVTSFEMEVNGRKIQGLLKERGQARADYDAAIQAGNRAAIAEEERPGTFTMRVGNLMPGEKAAITLVMTNPLPLVDGEATFRFPLVVAPRYIPGAPISGDAVGDGTAHDTDAVPDASRITPPVLLPGFPNAVALNIAVDVDPAGLPLGDMTSSLHAVVTESAGRGKRRITIHPGERLNRDFVLRLAYGDEAVTKSSLTVEEDADGKGGTFALTLVPPTNASKATKPRDVIFVLDRSGSMGGWKMIASRRACARMVDTLSDKDRFTVFAFDDSIEAPAVFEGTGLVSATDRNRFRAIEFLATVDARGGTEMAAPLDLAAKTLNSSGETRDRVLVMITDGQVGNEDQILQALAPQITGVRVFTVGIDSAVNEGFLKRFAAVGGGACELVESENRLDEAMDRLHRRIGTPVLTELKVEPAGLKIEKDSIVPARFPALFAGAPLVITGRFKGKAEGGNLTVGGTDSSGAPFMEKLASALSKGKAIGQTWARGHLRDLEDKFVITGGDSAQEKQIIDVSLAFSVLCRFTAYVAIDASEVVNKGGRNTKVTQPVDAPDGWDMFGADDSKADKSTDMRRRAPGGAMAGKSAVAQAPRAPSAMQGAPMELEAAEDMLSNTLGRASSGAGNGGMNAPVSKKPSPAPASPAKAVAKKMVARASISRAEKEEEERSVANEPSLDLSSYRKRAAELADALKAAGTGDAALRVIGEVAVKLGALIEDLKSVGANGDVAPLEALRKDLVAKLAAKNPDVASMAADGAKVLTAFATSGPVAPVAPPKRRGLAFWK